MFGVHQLFGRVGHLDPRRRAGGGPFDETLPDGTPAMDVGLPPVVRPRRVGPPPGVGIPADAVPLPKVAVPGAIKTLPSAFGVGVQTYQGRGERGEPSEPGPGGRQ